MAIPSRQIGWSTQSNLLWQISKRLELLIKVMGANNTPTTTSTTTTQSLNWSFVPNLNLEFPTSTTPTTLTFSSGNIGPNNGYTLYTGPWTDYDDGYALNPVILPTPFYINSIGSANLFISTNGYFTLGGGFGGNDNSPDMLANPPGAAANPQDLIVYPASLLTDNNYMNAWSKTYSDGLKYNVKLVLFSGYFYSATLPSSFILNFYRDSGYQYVETRLNYANVVAFSFAGPYDETNSGNVYKTSTETSQVWRGSLTGTNWTYLGMGIVQ